MKKGPWVLGEGGVGKGSPFLYAADKGNHPPMCAATRSFCSSLSSLTLNLLPGSFSFSLLSAFYHFPHSFLQCTRPCASYLRISVPKMSVTNGSTHSFRTLV